MVSESNAFEALRPLCIDLSRLAFQPKESFNPHSIELLEALKNVESKLASYDTERFSPKLADYIFLPISSLLKQVSLGESQTEYLLLIISHLMRLCWATNGTFAKELAQQLLPLITFLISPTKENQSSVKKSLEHKSAGCRTLYQFMKSLNEQSYKRQFFSPSNSFNLPSLGHCITILLDILEQTPEDHQVQLLVLDALLLLYQNIIDDGEILSLVLPGNVSSCCKVLSIPGLNVNYKVIVKTLHVLGTLLQIVYDDLSLNVQERKLTNIKELQYSDCENGTQVNFNDILIDELQLGSIKRHRDTAWLKATSAQVKRALQSVIPKLLKRNNREISAAMADFISGLLSRCSKSLHNCEDILISTLVNLKMDPKSQLSSHLNTLQDIINNKVLKLNDMIYFEDGKALASLAFALEALCEYDTENHDVLMEDICRSLLESLESTVEQSYLKSREDKIFEQSSNVILTSNFDRDLREVIHTPAIYSRLSKDMENTLGKFIAVLGTLACKENKFDNLCDMLLSEPVCKTMTRKTLALWISSWLIKCLQKQTITGTNDYLNFGEAVEYNNEVCYNVLEFCSDLAQEVTISAEGNTLSRQGETALSVVLFSMEAVCTVMQSDFSTELIDYLYIAIDSLASSSPVVRHFAQSCALVIAHELYDDSLRDMILDNVDYLAEAISARLNSGMTERVSTVFMVICKIAGYEVIERFRDVLETIFKLLDYYHGYDAMCLQFFELFEVIVLEMKKRYLSSNDSHPKLNDENSNKGSFAPWGMVNIQHVLSIMDKETTVEEEGDKNSNKEYDAAKNFQEYFDSKIGKADSDDEEENDEEEPMNTGDKDEGKSEEVLWVSPIPRASYKILLQICNYGDRLLTHRSKSLRVQILHVTKSIVPMLATQYESLLPQVAQIWDGLLECSLDSDYAIVKPACDCLHEVIRWSGNFIMKRFMELWKTWEQRSKLLRELKVGSCNEALTIDPKALIQHRKFPTVTKNALLSLCGVLMEGIAVTGLLLPDSTVKEMIFCCLQVLPAEAICENSLAVADVVYGIVHEDVPDL